MTLERDAILLQILREHKDRHITVTSARNEILRRDKQVKLDKAALRRWVNGKFSTLARRGLIEKHLLERGKAHFLVLNKGDEEFAKVVLRPPTLVDRQTDASHRPSPVNACDQLRKELDEYRLKAISQLGEIDEYRRVGEAFPDLRALAQEKFETTLDENCRILGKIRALEQLLLSGELR